MPPWHCIALRRTSSRRPCSGARRRAARAAHRDSNNLPLTLQRSLHSLSDHLEEAMVPSNASIDVVALQYPPSIPILGQLHPRLPTASHEVDQGILPKRDWPSWRPKSTKRLPIQHPSCPASVLASRNVASPSPLSPPLLLDPVQKLSRVNVLVHHPCSSPHPVYPAFLELTAPTAFVLAGVLLLFLLPRGALRR